MKFTVCVWTRCRGSVKGHGGLGLTVHSNDVFRPDLCGRCKITGLRLPASRQARRSRARRSQRGTCPGSLTSIQTVTKIHLLSLSLTLRSLCFSPLSYFTIPLSPPLCFFTFSLCPSLSLSSSSPPSPHFSVVSPVLALRIKRPHAPSDSLPPSRLQKLKLYSALPPFWASEQGGTCRPRPLLAPYLRQPLAAVRHIGKSVSDVRQGSEVKHAA